MRQETTEQVIKDLAKTIGMKRGKAKYALFAEDAADFVRRLTAAVRRDHSKMHKIRAILNG